MNPVLTNPGLRIPMRIHLYRSICPYGEYDFLGEFFEEVLEDTFILGTLKRPLFYALFFFGFYVRYFLRHFGCRFSFLGIANSVRLFCQAKGLGRLFF